MDLGRDKDSGKGAMNLSSRPASAATEHHSDGDVSEVRYLEYLLIIQPIRKFQFSVNFV